MNKSILYSALFLFTLSSFGQATDTIFLKEVTVQKTSSKVKHLKTSGTSSSLSGNPLKAIISKVDAIPAGNLSSIKLHFNNSPLGLLPDNDKKNYRDVEMGLLIYTVKDDGSPGEALTDKVIRFIVHPDSNSSITLDLQPLYLNTLPSMYFGIELLEHQSGTDFKIMIKRSKPYSNSLYMKSWNKDDWFGFGFGEDAAFHINMDLGIKLMN